jgi:acyl-CoA reductase-like NAD-dependent aldehyde dehydrogenase
VRKNPIGVVAAIAPWNFPQSLSASKFGPALASGCTLVLKPSPETVLDEMLFAEAVADAGIPDGVVNVVPAGPEVAAYLVAHPGVDKVAFTGSTEVGRKIAGICGPLPRRVTLELGGKSAAIVLDDADLDLATMGEKLFGATLINNGQTCYLSTRILAPRSRYGERCGRPIPTTAPRWRSGRTPAPSASTPTCPTRELPSAASRPAGSGVS